METIEKRPYELSLWEDLLTVGQNGSIQTDERKLCVISTDTIKSPIAAFDIQLNQKVNGEKTLTFSLNMTYWDEEEQKNLTNPYLTKLVNERKVKLKWKEKWYDFVIKGVSEDSKSKVFTYTAKDQLVQELAKNGYNIQFDQELENSIQTARNFVEEILRGTDWEVGECEPLYENTVESLYEFRAKQNLAVKAVIDDEDFTIKAGSTVFVPYSIIKNKTDRLQLLYSSTWNGGALPKDDEGTLLEGELYFKNYYIDNAWTDGDIPAVLTDPILRNDCRGRHYVRIAEKVYDSNIDKYVNVYKRSGEEYKDKIYYGFTKTDYLSQTIVENLISNNSVFTNTSGWKQAAKAEETDVTAMPPNLSTTNSVEDVLKNPDLPFESLLVLPPHTFSSSFHDNRAKVKELTAGDEYVLDIKYADDYDLTQFAKFTKIDICEYVIENSYYRPKKNGLVYFTANINNDNNIGGGHTFLECQYTLPATELNESKIGVFLYADGQKPVKIKSIALYRKLEVEGELVQPNQIVFENKDLVVTNYYYYEKVETPYDLSSLHYTATGLAPSPEYIQCYDETYQKKRSLTASKSNRFNLLQKVSEIFECWLDFQVEHYPDGRIKSKKIGLRKFIGDNNAAGFKYGVNLGPIKRKVDSDTIVTKMIVEANANEFAENGYCTISRASLNPSGTNVVYNFDYYTSQGLLSAESAQAALHSYYQATKAISDELNALQNTKIAKEKQIVENDAKAFFEIEKVEAAQKTLMESEEELVRVFKRPYSWFVNPSTTDPDEQKLYNDYLKNIQCTALLQQIIHCKKVIASYEEHESGPWALEAIVQSLRAEVEDINTEIQKCINRLTEKENDFHNKVGRFVQEGNWISEEYTDDNLYYLDSLSTLYTSSRPKVSYTIDVFDLSGIEGYENYRFKIGDKTFVQDPEFFGWTSKDGIRVPRREEVVVSETNECIDNISKTSIKVQNYKTQFEDLFQRIAAATESLQYNTGRYEKFSGVIDSEGAITQEALQQAVDKNGLVISGAGKQTVTCDDRGVTTIDNINPSSQVRIVGGGVFVSDDGGLTWSTGMTGEGINADVITSGRVDTGRVNIVSGGQKTHVWDEKGITAYKTEYNTEGVINKVVPSTFVRQDEFGIYGIKNDAEFNARKSNDGDPIGKIKDKASYALTWDGFMLRSGESGDGERVEITSQEDIQIFDKQGERIKIGRLDNGYGMKVRGAKDGQVVIGDAGLESGKTIVIDAGSGDKKFQVLEDGSMRATGAIFEGEVTATRLTLGENAKIGTSDIEGLDEQLEGYITDETLGEKLTEKNVAYRGEVRTVTEKDEQTGLTTTTSYYKDENGIERKTDTIYTYDGSDYVILSRDNTWGEGENLVIAKNGLLTAHNAVIYGTVFATNGEFTGKVTANSGSIGSFAINNGGLELNGELATVTLVAPTDGIRYTIGSIGDGTFTTSNWNTSETSIPIKYHYKVTDFRDEETGAFKAIAFSSESKVARIYLVGELPTGQGQTIKYYYDCRDLNYAEGGAGQIPAKAFKELYEDGKAEAYLIATYNKPNFQSGSTTVFSVSKEGTLQTEDLMATGGIIGGWDITDSGLSGQYIEDNTEYGVKLFQSYPTNENWRILVGPGESDNERPFRVNRDGQVWAKDDKIQTSDMNLKNSVESLPDSYSLLFDNLRPVRYKWNQNTSDRYHTGLIAQEFQQAIQQSGLTEKEVGALCTQYNSDGTEQIGIRYEELISLCIKEIQDLKKEVSVLKTQIEQLQS